MMFENRYYAERADGVWMIVDRLTGQIIATWYLKERPDVVVLALNEANVASKLAAEA